MTEQLHTYYVDPEGRACTEGDVEEAYGEMLDECYEALRVGESEYAPSDVLKNCDPTAYRIGLAEYLDSLAEDGWTEHCVSFEEWLKVF